MNTDKNKIVILLIHGFMALKTDMLLIEKALTEAGYRVHNADMCGHDTAENTFNEELFMATYWDDWFKSVEEQFLHYTRQGLKVIPVGHSMGGLIALRLAQKHAQETASVACIASPLYVNKLYPLEINKSMQPLCFLLYKFIKKVPSKRFHFKSYFKNKNKEKQKVANTTHLQNKKAGMSGAYYYPPQLVSLFKAMPLVEKNMDKVTSPLFCMQAFQDRHVSDFSSLAICRKAHSAIKELHMITILEKKASRHNIMLYEESYKQVNERLLSFFKKVIF